MKNKPAGFTLIELLVVIAIIGLLASFSIIAFNSARVKARDAKRKADISQIQKALEMYYNDYGTYPSCGGATNGPNNAWSNSSDESWHNPASLPVSLMPYMRTLPEDPLNTTSWAGWFDDGYNYSYVRCAGRSYMLVYKLRMTQALSVKA